jgi:nucleoside-diphosphate-sugar epimerase
MWGDGLQTRSFTFIDECVEGVLRLVISSHIILIPNQAEKKWGTNMIHANYVQVDEVRLPRAGEHWER